jgi:co-chaperonin GroES (HSP10)
MLYPLGDYLVVEPHEETRTSTGVLIPENIEIKTGPFKLAKVLGINATTKLEKGMRILVYSHMIEEAKVFNKTYYLVRENSVIGFYAEE